LASRHQKGETSDATHPNKSLVVVLIVALIGRIFIITQRTLAATRGGRIVGLGHFIKISPLEQAAHLFVPSTIAESVFEI
jgi:hypothetical protein